MNKISAPIAGMVDSFLQELKSSPAAPKPAPSIFGFKAQGTPYNCLKPKQLAAYLQVSLKTLERMRADGSGPLPIKLHNGCIRYPIVPLDAWMMEQWTLFLGHKPTQLPSYFPGLDYK